MAYISHNSCCLCLDCGGFTDSPVCPCGSHALANVARLLDRTDRRPVYPWMMSREELESVREMMHREEKPEYEH